MRALQVRRSAGDTPLCSAGHLPHKGGDRLVAGFQPNNESGASGFVQPISPLVGEMSGRTEGGNPPATLHVLTHTSAEA